MFKSINVLRLNHGQELLTQLNKYCENKGINSAVIHGINGALEKTELGTARKDGKWDKLVMGMRNACQSSLAKDRCQNMRVKRYSIFRV